MKADPGKIDRLNHGLYPSLAMLAGMQLNVFSPLAEGPMTAGALADRLGVDAGKLEPLLYALVIAELLEPLDGRRFANSPEADEYFVEGQAAYRGGAHELLSDLWAGVLQTAETIRTGQPQAIHDFSTMDDDALGAFFRGLHGGTVASAKNLLAHGPDLSGCRHLLDVGGGTGAVAITLCQAFPDLKATVLDLPRIARVVTPGFLSEVDMADRITVVEGDAVREPPPGRYDLVTMRALLQVLGPNECAALIANVAKAMAPNGRIVIVGRVLNDDRRTPVSTALFNLVFLNIYEAGLAHTEGEHRAWLEVAGFRDVQKQTLDPDTIIIAALPA